MEKQYNEICSQIKVNERQSIKLNEINIKLDGEGFIEKVKQTMELNDYDIILSTIDDLLKSNINMLTDDGIKHASSTFVKLFKNITQLKKLLMTFQKKTLEIEHSFAKSEKNLKKLLKFYAWNQHNEEMSKLIQEIFSLMEETLKIR
jgi:effector-binding domain-containing protein